MSQENTRRNLRRLAEALVNDLGNHAPDGDAGVDAGIDAVSRALPRMIGASAPDAGLFHPLCAELVTTVAQQVRAQAAAGDGDLFTVALTGEGDEDVGIDDVQPPLRAVLRAVLAELNDDSDDAAAQLAFIATDPDPRGQADALVHLVAWAHDLRRA